jgi:hypothetical protein
MSDDVYNSFYSSENLSPAAYPINKNIWYYKVAGARGSVVG